MKFVIQVVSRAAVTANGAVAGAIGRGFAVLAGVERDDSPELAARMVRKMLGLRLFPDADGKTNLSLRDAGGGLLLISQFTLCADCRRGNRPSFSGAMPYAEAEAVFEKIADLCRAEVPEVQTGVYGALMSVELVNEGPFTVILDSRDLF